MFLRWVHYFLSRHSAAPGQNARTDLSFNKFCSCIATLQVFSPWTSCDSKARRVQDIWKKIANETQQKAKNNHHLFRACSLPPSASEPAESTPALCLQILQRLYLQCGAERKVCTLSRTKESDFKQLLAGCLMAAMHCGKALVIMQRCAMLPGND